jgi:non-heme chloroperoxidase
MLSLTTSLPSAETISGPGSIPLYFETYGSPDAEQTVLLLHGGFQSLRCFRKQFAALAEHAFIIALDLPYHGRSLPVPETLQPSPALWAESVRAVLAHLHRLQMPLVIVAWSFGGLVTKHYLQTYGQEHLAGLVLVGSLFGGIETYQRFLQESETMQTVMTMLAVQVTLAERRAAFEQFISLLTYRPLPPDEFYEQYGYNVKSFFHTLGVTNHWLDELPDDHAQFLTQFQVPVLLIQGLQDALVPAAYTRHLALSLPQAQLLEYEQCGHSPFVEQPERFNQDVLRFLASLQEEEIRL